MPSIAEQIELLRLRERNVRPAPTLFVVPRPVERPGGSEEAERVVRVGGAAQSRASSTTSAEWSLSPWRRHSCA
jgi:hypothetical protein